MNPYQDGEYDENYYFKPQIIAISAAVTTYEQEKCDRVGFDNVY